jgi:NAD-dependent SIR2 family protein deacetylase
MGEPGLDQAAALLRGATRVAVLTGAGVSAESGVPTFRGGGGLWEGQRSAAARRAFWTTLSGSGASRAAPAQPAAVGSNPCHGVLARR